MLGSQGVIYSSFREPCSSVREPSSSVREPCSSVREPFSSFREPCSDFQKLIFLEGQHGSLLTSFLFVTLIDFYLFLTIFCSSAVAGTQLCCALDPHRARWSPAACLSNLQCGL